MNIHPGHRADQALDREDAAARFRCCAPGRPAPARRDRRRSTPRWRSCFRRAGRPQGIIRLLARLPRGFRPDEAYKATMPDLQNGPSALHPRRAPAIQHVGISNFRLPIRFHTRDNGDLTLETSVTGTVSLEAGKKGINMSRIMRSFYRHAEKTFSFGVIEAALDDYKADLGSLDARIQMRFSFPMQGPSLRSGLEGYQYYDIALELVERAGVRKKIMHLDYVYSSTCPCSLELSEHARHARGQLGDPAFATLGGAAVGGLRRYGAAVVRGHDRHRPRRRADRDAGDGQARGRTGLRRAQRRQPDLRRGRGAAVLRRASA